MKNDTNLHIPVSKDLKATLQKEAFEKGLTLSTYVRMIIIERGK